MNATVLWLPGETIVLRAVWHKKLWWAMPVYLVLDTPELAALYWPAGTCGQFQRIKTTPQDLISAKHVELSERPWVNTDVLMLTAVGEAHAVYAMWDSGKHDHLRCWYINLEEPLRRTKLGFDTMDQILDIVVNPGCSEWHWKDEDEFTEAVSIGVFSIEEAAAIRKEGECALKQLKERDYPYNDDWERWQPPDQWTIPVLPTGWDQL